MSPAAWVAVVFALLFLAAMLRSFWCRGFARGRADAFRQVTGELGALALGCRIRAEEQWKANHPASELLEQHGANLLSEVAARFAELVEHPMANRSQP